VIELAPGEAREPSGECEAFASREPRPVTRGLPMDGVNVVELRAGRARCARVVRRDGPRGATVAGIPIGGAKGYHSPDPGWRETPARYWGMQFVTKRFGDRLVISTKSEISYIHHQYSLDGLVLRVPRSVKVVLVNRHLSGDGTPELDEHVHR
jgi:hypothetical protein